MKKLFIVANWKSNKTIKETEQWMHDFHEGLISNSKEILLENKEIVVAPSFIALEHANYCSLNLKLPIKLGAQNISPFNEGPYTGEVNVRQIKEFANYVIIGHSERRVNFHENNDVINKKITIARQYGLTSILCISDLKQLHNSTLRLRSGQELIIHNSNCIVAYEPLLAIGSGQADTPQNAENIAKKIKGLANNTSVLYGGSVTSLNINSFTKMPNIDGVLIGGASLNPLEFLEIVKNA